jgi:hypothetical protein
MNLNSKKYKFMPLPYVIRCTYDTANQKEAKTIKDELKDRLAKGLPIINVLWSVSCRGLLLCCFSFASFLVGMVKNVDEKLISWIYQTKNMLAKKKMNLFFSINHLFNVF